MAEPLRQGSFAAGELAKALWRRPGLRLYNEGARKLRNFMVDQTGAAVSRPGTQFIVKTKTDGKKVRLVPFFQADDVGYVLEFGNLYVRFILNGAQVESSPGVPLEVVTTYLEADLPRLKFTQSGDILTITHPNYTPRELTLTAGVWAIANVSFAIPTKTWADFKWQSVPQIPADDAEHPLQYFKWKFTVLGRTANGQLIESQPIDVATGANDVVYPDRPLTVNLVISAGTFFSLAGFRFYRGRNNTFGYIGEVDQTAAVFVDTGNEPDFFQPPPTGRNPFEVYAANGTTLVRTEEPTACCYFEDRLVYAGTAERPVHVFGSMTSNYTNFDERRPSTADEAVEFDLAARRRETIRGLLSKDQLLIFTDANVWAANGPGGAPLAPTDLIQAKVQLAVGSSWLDPLEVGDSVLFNRAKGSGVFDLNFSTERKGYLGGNISARSNHLVGKPRSVVDWTYAEDPWGMVWLVRDDGRLLSLTYFPALETVAWAWHDTEGATNAKHTDASVSSFENVCAIPEGDEDAVYVVVKRTIAGVDKRYIERMTDRVITDSTALKDVVCLDSSVSRTGAATTAIGGLSHLNGKTVYANADGLVQGPFVVAAGAIVLTTAAVEVHTGLRYFPEMETLDAPSGRRQTVSKVLVDLEAADGVKVGEDFDNLTPWVPEELTVIETSQAEQRISHKWNDGGRVVVQQSKPLPLTVYGVTRMVDSSDGR